MTWIIPLVIMLLALGLALAGDIADQRRGGYLGGLSGCIGWLLAVIVSLGSWLVWALL